MSIQPLSEAIDVIKQEEKQKVNILNRSKQLDEQRDLLRKVVHKNANPDPTVVVLICLIIIMTVWLIYVMFMKPNMSGVWYDNNDRKWVLDHDKWSTGLMVYIENIGAHHCKVSGNMVTCNGILGVWDNKNKVVFMNGTVIDRVRV